MRGRVVKVQRVDGGEGTWLWMRRSPLGLFDMNTLRVTAEGAAIGMATGRRGRWFIRRRRPTGGGGDLTGGARGSHAISKGMTGSGDLALWTGVTSTVELIMAHPVAMETGCPVSYMRVWERLVVLGQGQIWGVRGAWVVGDMEIGRECGNFCPEVV